MDITLVELHVDGKSGFSPSGALGKLSSSKSDESGSSSKKSQSGSKESGSGSKKGGSGSKEAGGSSRGRMAALGVLVLLALLAYGTKRMMGSDMDEIEELDEIPA